MGPIRASRRDLSGIPRLRPLPVGYTFVHAYDDDLIMAGQGTVGLELLEDLDAFDAVVAPVGGGGLLAGIAVAIKESRPSTEVIGVQVHAAPSAFLSFVKAP